MWVNGLVLLCISFSSGQIQYAMTNIRLFFFYTITSHENQIQPTVRRGLDCFHNFWKHADFLYWKISIFFLTFHKQLNSFYEYQRVLLKNSETSTTVYNKLCGSLLNEPENNLPFFNDSPM